MGLTIRGVKLMSNEWFKLYLDDKFTDIKQDIGLLREEVEELKEFKLKALGFASGLGFLSGCIGFIVVKLFL